MHALLPRGPRGEGAAYNGLYGEAPPKRATFFPRGVLPMMVYAGYFFRLQVYERVGISLVELIKGWGNLSFGSVKEPKRIST